MIKVLVVISLVLACHVAARIDGSSFGMPTDTRKTAFGSAIEESAGLADEGDAQLQLVEVNSQDEAEQSASHVKEMFSNAFNSIKAQREAALASTASSA